MTRKTASPANLTPRIAVLAVHGVADQDEKETARQAAGLLLGEHLPVDYETFREEDIYIGLRTIEHSRKLVTARDGLWNFPPVQSSSVSQSVYDDEPIRYETGFSLDPKQLSDEEIEHESMREQLQGYKSAPADSMLKTIMLTGKRYADERNSSEPVIDIFEAYWADLSRLKNGFFTVFFEFYLLLFFFSRIGGIAVERAVAHFPDSNDWRHLQKLHWISEVALVLGVPITHLALLTMASSGIPLLFENTAVAPPDTPSANTLFLTGIALLAGGAGMITSHHFGKRLDPRWWPWLFLAILLVTAIAVALSQTFSNDYRAHVLLSWLFMALGVLALCRIYDSRRPGAFLFGAVFVVLTGVVFVLFILNADGSSKRDVFLQGIAATEIMVYTNVLMWLIFIFCTLFSSIIGFLAISRSGDDEKEISRKTAWTQALSLILPGSMVMLLTFALWQALFVMSGKLIDPGLLKNLQQLIDAQIFPHLGIALSLTGIGILFALWMISPAPLCETANSGDTGDCSGKGMDSGWVGAILTNAYDRMRWSGELIRVLLLVALPLEWFFLMDASQSMSEGEITAARMLILYTGLGFTILIFGSKGPFSFIALGFRSGLDMALDVANWLRFRPREHNPRGAICRRYISILRHIAQWRDPQTGRGYDALVIVSHSQGTVITADILRYLKREYEDENVCSKDQDIARYFDRKDPLTISLLTFGSPLRQLYYQRFPLQYRWAGTHTGEHDGVPLHGPDPEELGVVRWSNLYCSGDYVGRHLWYDKDDPKIWQPVWNSPSYPGTRERCLGVGGHTQYWSGSLEEVARELDKLICEAASCNECD